MEIVILPTDATSVTLQYWQRPGGSSDGVDYREALLLRADYSVLATLERVYTVTGADSWAERSFDITGFRGQTVVVYFNVYNNGGGGQQWNYLDQAALTVCAPSIATMTPTPTATPNPTETNLSPTPDGSLTPTKTTTPEQTPTATPTLAPTAPANLTEKTYLPLVSS